MAVVLLGFLLSSSHSYFLIIILQLPFTDNLVYRQACSVVPIWCWANSVIGISAYLHYFLFITSGLLHAGTCDKHVTPNTASHLKGTQSRIPYTILPTVY